jgi:hypothetical protein
MTKSIQETGIYSLSYLGFLGLVLNFTWRKALGCQSMAMRTNYAQTSLALSH